MPTTEWLNKYESIKEKLSCKTDLDTHCLLYTSDAADD